jgi:hypothetical protein
MPLRSSLDLPIIDMSYPPRYKFLPATDEQTKGRSLGSARPKKIILHILAIIAIMYATFSGVRYISRSNLKFPKGLWGCHGAQRNLSSLPSHYTLPSGDKVPSVALGRYRLHTPSALVLLLNWILHRCLAGGTRRSWNRSAGA